MHVEQDRNLLGISSISSYTLSFYQCGFSSGFVETNIIIYI